MDQNIIPPNPSHSKTSPSSTVVNMFQFYPLLLLLLLLPQTVWTFPHRNPRLSFLKNNDANNDTTTTISKNFETYFYTQTLDHFNYGPQSYATFRQRYVINSKHWGGRDYPILAYLGAEESLDELLTYIGFLDDNAPYFQSLSVYIEHRYYGESVPFESMEKAMESGTTRGYFNSAQAIADYAEILLHIKDTFRAHNSPIIVVGASYGGMLATWFRLKYPHIALGALASSAPILYFDNSIVNPQDGYYSIISKNFKDVSNNCYQTIQKSWSEIDEVASKHNGLSTLSRRFKTCSNLSSSFELKDFLDYMYVDAAQYDAPPDYPNVAMVCEGIDKAPKNTDIIGRIFAGVVSVKGSKTCYETKHDHPSQTSIGWRWQRCSELAMRIGRGENAVMFQPAPFNTTGFYEDCKTQYGVAPRPHWITTYYGGRDMKYVLKSFGSNIIFSNGLRDPYSSGGVLENLSETVVAVTTIKGSHCMDIYRKAKSDPTWLVVQRESERKIIAKWLKK